MSKENDNIVDLVPNKGGVYESKDSTSHPVQVKKEEPQPTGKRGPNQLGDFLAGLDAGLELLEGVDKRAERLLKLKKKKV